MAKQKLQTQISEQDHLSTECKSKCGETPAAKTTYSNVTFKAYVSHGAVEDCRAWLQDLYAATSPPHVEGDDLATTYLSCGTVLLAACRLNCFSSQHIHGVTRLPIGFIAMVLFNITHHSECFPILCTAAGTQKKEASIANAMKDMLEEYWENLPFVAMDSLLTVLRAGRLFGGKEQQWHDPESDNLRRFYL